MKLHPYSLDFLSFVAGILLTLSFAPFNIFPFAVLATSLLLTLWLMSSRKRAFWRGWLFGCGLFGTGVYWVFISINTYGNSSLVLGLSLTAALIGYLALYPAFSGYLLVRFFPTHHFTKLVCAFPAIWVVLEWARSWMLTGFPWLLVGYSQINSPLSNYAAIFSVYGVSLATLITSGLLVDGFINTERFKKNLIYVVILWLVATGLYWVNWTTPNSIPVKVSLIQGNIPQNLKWSPDQVQPTLDRYRQLTEAHWDSQIVIWPESAIPLPLNYAEDFLNNIAQTAAHHDMTLITGIPIKSKDREGYFNSVIALGQGNGFYIKQQLVPFGEYIPFRNVIGRVFDFLQVPMSDFIAAPSSATPIFANGFKIATFICYEIAFPELVNTRDKAINLILTVSNDAWFGHSIAQAQHLEMAQMRALELGRPVLFATNNGITAIINAKGRVQSIAPPYQTCVLTANIETTQGRTPWQLFSMDSILLVIIFQLFFAIKTARRERKEAASCVT